MVIVVPLGYARNTVQWPFTQIYLYPHALGLVFSINFPWQPYSGKSDLAVFILFSIPFVLAEFAIALLVGAGVAFWFRFRPFIFGILVGTPAAIAQVSILLSTSSVSFMGAAWLAKDFFLVLVGPGVLAAIIHKLNGRRSPPSGTPSIEAQKV